MSRPPASRFLARRSYRRRRLRDAARLLPIVGGFFFMLPVLRPESARGTAWGLVYLFAVWAGLIVAAAILARPLARGADTDKDGGDRR